MTTENTEKKGLLQRLTRKKTWIVLCAAAVARILISHIIGVVFFPSQICDDVLMLSYAGLGSHFTQPAVHAMSKTMVFPIFLDVVSVSHIPYHFWLSGLYIAAAAVTYLTVKRIFSSEKLALAAYIYILFIPAAFEYWTGLRIYRNAIVLPCVILLFALLLRGIFDIWFPSDTAKEKTPGLLYFLFLGAVFTVNYYIREDGIWLKVVFMAALFAMIAGILFRGKKSKMWRRAGIRLVFCLCSVLVFAVCTVGYKMVNKHFFGVYGIETRTSGEQGGFVQRLFKIDAEGRSSIIWTPAAAIDKAFAASPTLASLPGYRDAVIGCPEAEGDMYAHPVTGERMGWVTKNAMLLTGLFESEAASEAIFAKVNAELDAAFADGTLPKADRIQLLSSSGGFTLSEILELRREMGYGLLSTIWCSGTRIGAQPPNAGERYENREVTEFAAKITRESKLLDYDTTQLSGLQKATNALLSVLNRIYGIVNVLLFALSLFLAFWGLVAFFRRKLSGRSLAYWLCLGVFGCIGLVYLFGISWYSHFIWGNGPVDTGILHFYLPALPGIWFFTYLFAVGGCKHILPRKEKKAKEEQ